MDKLYRVSVGLECAIAKIEKPVIKRPNFPMISIVTPSQEYLRHLEQSTQQPFPQFVPDGQLYFLDDTPRRLDEQELFTSILFAIEQAKELKGFVFNPNFIHLLLLGEPIPQLDFYRVVKALYKRVYRCDGTVGSSRFPGYSILSLSGEKSRELLEDEISRMKGTAPTAPPYDSLSDLLYRSQL